MADFLLLMHDDARVEIPGEAWGRYFAMLREAEAFAGGSSIGDGATFRKDGAMVSLTPRIAGYIRLSAADFDAARALIAGNPVFEHGGTVELRELPIEG